MVLRSSSSGTKIFILGPNNELKDTLGTYIDPLPLLNPKFHQVPQDTGLKCLWSRFLEI